MAKYLISVMEPVGGTPDPEMLKTIQHDVMVIDQEMRDTGAWVFGGALHQPSATTVLRAQDGEVVVTDGPYVESKEHLGGFSVVECDDLDGALEWARRFAVAIRLPIEVRPFRAP